MKATNYKQALREYAVREFIQANGRSPNLLELDREITRLGKKFPSLAQVGFAGHLVTKPGFASVSSAETENTNRQAMYTDVRVAGRRINDNLATLENSFRGFYATARNMKRKLDSIESRIDNVLLLSGSTDAFVYGIEEDFVLQDKIDWDNTTASVESGFVTIGREGFGLVDLTEASISFTTVADNGYVGFQNTSSAETLKTDDGDFWEHLVYTNYRSGRVSLLLNITLPDPQFISEVRFTASTGGINSKVKATVFYSLDEKTYKAVSPEEMVLVNEENLFNIGVDGVKTIRIMLSKDQHDNTTFIKGQYVYTFSLDSVKVYSKSYTADGESLLISGPYDVVDEEGSPVFFTKATCEICVSQGDTEAVSTYLSIDGVDYVPVDTEGNASNIVTFGNSALAGTSETLDETVSSSKVIDTALVDLGTFDGLINTAISEDYFADVSRKSIVIKRNLPIDSNTGRVEVYGAPAGWFYDQENQLYKTTVYVNSPDGQGIDLGNTSAYINGVLMTGQITLLQGYSVFETAESNYQVIDKGITTLRDFKRADSLYPYNHKYLIEGYVYPDTFVGEEIYNGVDEYFGELLEYVSPEAFTMPENDRRLDIYTLDYYGEKTVFKVKIDKCIGTWANEEYGVSWLVNRGTGNQVWFKMILNSSVDNSSPVLSNVKVRVI